MNKILLILILSLTAIFSLKANSVSELQLNNKEYQDLGLEIKAFYRNRKNGDKPYFLSLEMLAKHKNINLYSIILNSKPELSIPIHFRKKELSLRDKMILNGDKNSYMYKNVGDSIRKKQEYYKTLIVVDLITITEEIFNNGSITFTFNEDGKTGLNPCPHQFKLPLNKLIFE